MHSCGNADVNRLKLAQLLPTWCRSHLRHRQQVHTVPALLQVGGTLGSEVRLT
jgi:hypothetical protein